MLQTFSPKQLARVIGVSESSIKRWVDQGRVRVTRTQGGHRRIPLDESIRLIREHDVNPANLAALGIDDLAACAAKSPDPADALYEALRSNQAARAKGIMLSAYLQGMSLEQLFDDLIAPAMHRIGRLWEHGQEGIAIEHHATDVCIQAVNQLRTYLPPVDPGAPVAIGGAPEDDPYILPSIMAATICASHQFDVINLGPATPLNLLVDAARCHKAKVVWVSISMCRQGSRLGEELRRDAEHLSRRGVRMIVGGRAVPASLTRDGRHLEVLSSMVELGAFARGLRVAIESPQIPVRTSKP